jgi:hypothetical protein
MKNVLRYGIAALLLAGAGVYTVSLSEARSFPAFLGQPQAPSDYPCFGNSGGAVFNNCSTTRRFCVTLPVDSSNHTIQITVLAPDINHNIACFGQAITRDIFNAGFTGFFSPGVFGSSQVLNLPTLSVPNAGGLYACCDIAPTASLQSFNY